MTSEHSYILFFWNGKLIVELLRVSCPIDSNIEKDDEIDLLNVVIFQTNMMLEPICTRKGAIDCTKWYK